MLSWMLRRHPLEVTKEIQLTATTQSFCLVTNLLIFYQLVYNLLRYLWTWTFAMNLCHSFRFISLNLISAVPVMMHQAWSSAGSLLITDLQWRGFITSYPLTPLCVGHELRIFTYLFTPFRLFTYIIIKQTWTLNIVFLFRINILWNCDTLSRKLMDLLYLTLIIACVCISRFNKAINLLR